MKKLGNGSSKHRGRLSIAIILVFFMLSIGIFSFLVPAMDQDMNQGQIDIHDQDLIQGTRASQTMETEHFRITYEEGQESFAQKVIDTAEEIYPEASLLANHTLDTKLLISIPQCLQYTCWLNTGGYSGINIAFQSEWSVNWAYTWGTNGRVAPIIAHEVHHALLCKKLDVSNLMYSGLPWWYYDGLADYFSDQYYDGMLKDSNPATMSIYMEYDALKMLDDMTTWEGRLGSHGYVEGYSVFTYIAEEHGPEALSSFIENSERNQSVHDGFTLTFNMTQDEFQTLWLDWLANDYTKDIEWERTILGGPLTNTSADGTKIPTSWVDGRILYVSDKHGTLDIFSVKEDGTDIQRLTDNYDIIDTDARYSPDAGTIMFTSDRGEGHGVHLMDHDGSNVRALVDDQHLNFAGSWAPDGESMTFTSDRNGNYDIFSINKDGTAMEELTNDPGSDGNPIFSPDGKKIMFVSDRTGSFQIFMMDRDGENVEQVTDMAGDITSGTPLFWSPDGKNIIFEVKDSYLQTMYTMSLDDLEPQVLFAPTGNTTGTNIRCPLWSEDGNSIVFPNYGEIFIYEVYEPVPSSNNDFILIFIGILLTTIIGTLLIWVIRKYS